MENVNFDDLEIKKIDNKILIAIIPILIIYWLLIFNSKNFNGFLLLCGMFFLIFTYTRDIYSLIFCIVFIHINNQFANIIFEINSLDISINQLMYIGIIICTLIMFFDKKFIKYKRKLIVPISYYLIWYAFLFANNIIQGNTKFTTNIYLLSLFLISIIIQILVISDIKYCKALIYTIVCSIMVIVIIGYLEFLLGKTFFLSEWAQEERYRYGILRIGSTVGSGNFMCIWLIPSYILFKTNAFSKVINKNFLNFMNILIFIQIILSLSRLALVVLAIVVILQFFSKDKKRFYFSLPFILLFMIAFTYVLPKLYNVDSSSNFVRETVNKLSYDVWSNNLLTGVGFDQFTVISSKYNISDIIDGIGNMNTYYFILTSSGLIGLILYIRYLFFIFKSKIKNLFKNKDNSYMIIIIIAWSINIYTLDCFSIILLWIFPSLFICVDKINERS